MELNKQLVEELGFIVIDIKKSNYKPFKEYGKAKDKYGMTFLKWNNEGASCDYFGNKLEDNIFITIEKDAGTRTVFNGIVHNIDELKLILKLVQ